MSVVLCLITGLLLLLVGPGLLEETPWPATSRYRPHARGIMPAPERARLTDARAIWPRAGITINHHNLQVAPNTRLNFAPF